MTAKVDIDYRDAFVPTMEAFARGGALMVSVDDSGRPSGMALTWGALGSAWGRPIFSAFVRPSRHTSLLLDRASDFTVNLLPAELGHALDYWGHSSGRNVDKWARTGLRPAPSRRVRSPIVEQGILHFECRVICREDLATANLVPELIPAYYASGDRHRVYHGEIVACYAV